MVIYACIRVDPTTYPANAAGDVDLSQMPDVIRRGTGMCGLSAPLTAFDKFDGGELFYCRAVQVLPNNTVADIQEAIGVAEGWNRDDICEVTNPETNVEYGPRDNVFDIIKNMRTLDEHIFCMRFEVPGAYM